MMQMNKKSRWTHGFLALVMMGLALGSSLTAREAEEKPAAFLGVSVQRIDSEEKTDLGIKWGVRVVGIERKSPADKAGIEEEDILLTFRGEKIRQPLDLSEMVAEAKPGDTVKIELMREKQTKTLTLSLGERKEGLGPRSGRYRREFEPVDRPRPDWKEEKRPYLGIGMEMVEGDYGSYFGLKEKAGVVVRKLEEDGPAAKAGLKAGDLLVSLGEQKIESVSDVHKALKEKKPGEKIEISVQRHGKKQEITLTLGEQTMSGFHHFFRGNKNWMPKGDFGIRHFFFDGDESFDLRDLGKNIHMNLDELKDNIRVIRKKLKPLSQSI